MRVDKRITAWRHRGAAKYRLFAVGGGAWFGPIRNKLWNQPPIAPEWTVKPSRLTLPRATKVVLPGGEIVPLRELGEPQSEPLLLLAYGLAHPRPDIPKYERDVEGVERVVREKDHVPDVVTGHWW